MFFSLDDRGVSLTEALVAAGMVGGLSLGYLQLSGDHQKTQKKIEAGFEIDMLTLEMAQTLSNDKACTETLNNRVDGDIEKIKNSARKVVFQKGNKYGQNLIEITSMKLQNDDISGPGTDGFGSVELKVEFKKTANIIKGKKEEERIIPLAVQKSGSTVICNPDPATRFLASDAKLMMCDSIKGVYDAATEKCKPKFIDASCGTYIVGFTDDGTRICETTYSFP